VSKVTEKIKTRSKPTTSENFNSHPLQLGQHNITEVSSYPIKTVVWFATSQRRIIYSIFFNETVYSQRYQRFVLKSLEINWMMQNQQMFISDKIQLLLA
jgi:hypothetical protein